jgi:hypothetical protein
MKYLKTYRLFESIGDGLSKEDVKNVFESYINWDLISDTKHLSMEYLDDGLDLVIIIKYKLSEDFNLVENVWSLDLSHEKEVSSWHLPSDNVYELEPIDSKSIEYFIYLRKDYDLQRNETVDIIESILSRYPNANINRVSSADNSQKRIVIGLDRRYSDPTNESQNLDLFDDCRDMFLELQDSGYVVNVDMRPEGFDRFCLKVSNDRLFQWVDVKEDFTRAKKYLYENGWELTKINLHFYGPYARIKEFMNFSGSTYNYFIHYITEPEFIQKNKIYEIAFIFDPIK